MKQYLYTCKRQIYEIKKIPNNLKLSDLPDDRGSLLELLVTNRSNETGILVNVYTCIGLHDSQRDFLSL